MESVRIGNDIFIAWDIIRTDGVDIDIEHANNVIVSIINQRTREVYHPLSFNTKGNIVTFSWPADKQKSTGVHNLIIKFELPDASQEDGSITYTTDLISAFELTAYQQTSYQQTPSVQVKTLQFASKMEFALRGLSAYDVAVINGFVGSESEWILSLKQPAIDAGEIAESQGNKAETQGNTAEAQGSAAETKGNTAKANGDYAKAEGDKVNAQLAKIVQLENNQNDMLRGKAKSVRFKADTAKVGYKVYDSFSLIDGINSYTIECYAKVNELGIFNFFWSQDFDGYLGINSGDYIWFNCKNIIQFGTPFKIVSGRFYHTVITIDAIAGMVSMYIDGIFIANKAILDYRIIPKPFYLNYYTDVNLKSNKDIAGFRIFNYCMDLVGFKNLRNGGRPDKYVLGNEWRGIVKKGIQNTNNMHIGNTVNNLNGTFNMNAGNAYIGEWNGSQGISLAGVTYARVTFNYNCSEQTTFYLNNVGAGNYVTSGFNSITVNGIGTATLICKGTASSYYLHLFKLSATPAVLSNVCFESANCIAEYIPSSLTPTKWYDTSGQGNHLTASGTPELIYENPYQEQLWGSGAPTVIPNCLFQEYIDETGKNIYKAVGTTAVTDWKQTNN